jgi:hypothetical protein
VGYVRTVKTASGAVAVQIVHSNWRGSREIEHIGSAHTPGEVEVLKAVAQQRLRANQDTFDFDDGQLGDDEAPIVSSQARHLWETLSTAYRVLGLDLACGDEVFRQLVLSGDRADQQARLDPRLGGARHRGAVVSHDQAPAARVRQGRVAAAASRGVC